MAGTGVPHPIALQRYLGGVQYPASKAALVAEARREGAPDGVARTLERLPADAFDSPTAVSKAASKLG